MRDHLGVSARNLKILRDAMLAETEDRKAPGRPPQVPGLQICGKTGTAQVMNEHNQEIDRTTWFASFAPYENPRYAVVVMVESGTFGGTDLRADCARHLRGNFEKGKHRTRRRTLARKQIE